MLPDASKQHSSDLSHIEYLTHIEYTENLFACLQERCELLEALKTLAEAHAMIATQSEVDVILGLLARKQALLEQLAEVQERMKPYFSDEPDNRIWKSNERKEQCRQVAKQGQQLLTYIAQLEHTALNELTLRREAVAAQLQDGKDSIIASSAYRSDDLLAGSTLDIGNL